MSDLHLFACVKLCDTLTWRVFAKTVTNGSYIIVLEFLFNDLHM